jgi:glutathione peroxidase
MSTTAIYDIPLQRLDGQPTTLGAYKGQVLLVVNVASKCGLTPQYEGLEKLYEQYQGQGFQVLGFPCNDFLGQEPGSAEEIQSFCTLNYSVKFPMFSKVQINSAPRHPLYAALIEAQPKATPAAQGALREKLASKNLLPAHASDVMWNFEKFLISKDGKVLARFAPDVTPDAPELKSAIEAALG